MIKKAKKIITWLLLAVYLTATIPVTTTFAWTAEENKQYVDWVTNNCKQTSWNKSIYEKDEKFYVLGFDGNTSVKPGVGGDRMYYTDADGCLVKNTWENDNWLD